MLVYMNAEQIQMAVEDLAELDQHVNLDACDNEPVEMADEVQDVNGQNLEFQVPHHSNQPQDTISFDQSGSTAEYLRATSPDIVLNVEDILQGMQRSESPTPTNSSSSIDSEIQSYHCITF